VQRLANGDLNIGGDWVAEQKVLSNLTGVNDAFLPLSVVEKLKPDKIPEGAWVFPGTRGTPMSFQDIDTKTPGKWPEPVMVTEAGRQAAKQFDSLTLNERLLNYQPTNILADWAFDFHANKIIQDKGTITMKYGFMDLSRTIHVNLSQYPDNIELSPAGHSICRWENDVLIVDTVGFKPDKIMRVTEAMYSEQMHIIERFSLDTKTMALKRDYVAKDPLYFEGRYTGSDVVYHAKLAHEPYSYEDLSKNAISP